MTALTRDRSVVHGVGKVVRTALRTYGNEGKEMFTATLECAMDIKDGSHGRTTLQTAIFPNQKSPNLPREMQSRLNEGDLVEVRGWLDIREYTDKNGIERKSYSISWPRFHTPKEGVGTGAEFALLGKITRVKGNRVTLQVDNSYTTRAGQKRTMIKTFEVTLPDDIFEREELNLETGARYEMGGSLIHGFFSKSLEDAPDNHFKSMLGQNDGHGEKFRDTLLVEYARYLGQAEEEEEEPEEVPF